MNETSQPIFLKNTLFAISINVTRGHRDLETVIESAKASVSENTFDEFLAERGLLEETEAIALKQVIADQVRSAMEDKGLTKTAMAERIQSSRQQLDRLLDPNYQSVTLLTLHRAAAAVGRTLRVELI